MNKQINIFDILEQPRKKASTNVSKPVDKTIVIAPRKVGHIVCR